VKRHLIIKLLAINLLVIAFVMVVVWFSINTLAAGYFVTLMEKYNISPKPAHEMFIGSVHRYLIWASLGAVVLAAVLSFVMMRRVLAPLTRMTAISKEIAAGNFAVSVPTVTEDEVGQLARAFNQMADSLDKIQTLRRNLIIDVAHELRTPLTNIRGYLEALLDRVIPPSAETFAMLQEETLRLVSLTEEVLQLARADAARNDLDRTATDLREAIDLAIAPFTRAFAQRGIRVDIQAPASPLIVSADRGRLARVLRNLADNGARYTPADTTLVIAVAPSGEYARVTFGNACDELSTEDLPLIFERFYRGEKSRSRQSGGAGIGLAIVKDLVEAHGGKVGADLTEGRLQVWFDIPRSAARQAAA
jgi:two-component system, OmpR family, sensor histidine kinase BaeS